MTDLDRPKISDDALRGYLAGRLTSAAQIELDAALLADPELADRMVALDALGPDLRMAADRMLEAAPVARMEERLDRMRAPRKPWRLVALGTGLIAASFGAGVALGPLVLPTATPPQPAGWVAAASGMVRLFAPSTFADAPGPVAVQAALDGISAQTGTDLSRFARAGEFTLVRADLLAFEDKPLVQLVYLTPDARIVALCILVRPLAAAAKADPQRKPAQVGDLATYVWDAANLGFLVLGRDADAVQGLADLL